MISETTEDPAVKTSPEGIIDYPAAKRNAKPAL
jgi:hypothetical protein